MVDTTTMQSPVEGAAEIQVPGLHGPIDAPIAGRSLPGPFYLRQDLFALELERFFFDHWLFVGHSCEVAERGDYLTYSIGSESVIVVRTDNGECRALHNVCRHRGSRVCTADSGKERNFVCPYHAWTYDLDGRLIAARQMPPGFDKSEYGLRKAHAVEFCGLIFVCLAEVPPPFDDVRSDAGPRLAPYRLDRTAVAFQRDYLVDANWKVIAENFRECYHCGPAHPEYCRVISGAAAAEWERQETPERAAQRSHWEDLGIDFKPVEFSSARPHHIGRHAYQPGCVSQSVDGGPVAPLLGELTDYDTGVLAFALRPNFLIESTADYAVSMRMTPVTPLRTQFRMTWVVNQNAVAGRDYLPEKVAEFWTVTGEQDWTICSNTQLGVGSRAYSPGPLAPGERSTGLWLDWYLEALGARRDDPAVR